MARTRRSRRARASTRRRPLLGGRPRPLVAHLVAVLAAVAVAAAAVAGASVPDGCQGRLGIGAVGHVGGRPGELGAALRTVSFPPGRTARSVSAGFAHTCAVLDDDRVACWGENRTGALGVGDGRDRGLGAVHLGGDLAHADQGAASAVSVVAGYRAAFAVDAAGAVRCWGDNSQGQLGSGDRRSRGARPGEMGDSLPPVPLASAPVTSLSVTVTVRDQSGQVVSATMTVSWDW